MATVSAAELAVPDGYTVAPGRTSGASRHWFDTFDRRLLAGGGQLYLEMAGGRARVVMDRGDGTPVVADWPGPPGPVPEVLRSDELPEPVRAAVDGLPGRRALVHLLSARLQLREDRVLDAEEKTVCRVAVQTAVAPGGDRPVEAVTAAALRGYEAETEQIRAAVSATGATVAGLLSDLLGSVHASDAPGAGAPGRDLRPDMPAPAALASLVGHLLETVSVNVPGTLGQYDQEFLHDLRVAVRRGRTALKLGRGVVAEQPRAQLADELKWLGDVTTPARDLDVNLEGFPDLEAVAVSAELQDATAPFTELIEGRGRQAHRQLDTALRSPRFRGLMARAPALLAALATPTGDPSGASPNGAGPDPADHQGGGAGLSTAELARQRLGKTFGAVMKRGKRIDDHSPDEAVHDLRKRAKELRYTIEFFSGLLPGGAAAPLVKDLKGMQDVLGDFNDTVVQRALLLECAESLADQGVGPRTILVLGEMRRELARAGQKARGELPERYARLRQWRKDGRWRHLLDSLG